MVLYVAEGVGEERAETVLYHVVEDDLDAVGEEVGDFGFEGGCEGVEGLGDAEGGGGCWEEGLELFCYQGRLVWCTVCGWEGLFRAGVVLDDSSDVVDADVEVVDLDEEGDDGLFWGLGALDGCAGVALVAHFALCHADEVGAQDAGQRWDHVGDDGFLGGGEGLLQDFVDNIHDVVDRRGDMRWIRLEWALKVQCQAGRGLVQLEGLFDRAAEEEGRHGVEWRD